MVLYVLAGLLIVSLVVLALLAGLLIVSLVVLVLLAGLLIVSLVVLVLLAGLLIVSLVVLVFTVGLGFIMLFCTKHCVPTVSRYQTNYHLEYLINYISSHLCVCNCHRATLFTEQTP